MLSYSSDEEFFLILDVYDRLIPYVNNRRIKRFFAKYSTVFCNVRYDTRTNFMVKANASIPHVTWIIAITRFLYFVTIVSTGTL